MLPKTTDYVKRFGGKTKWFYFLIKNDDLYPKNNTIWDKFSVDAKKEFESRPVCEKNVLIKTKMKSHGEEVTDFYDKKVDSNYTCLHSL